MFIGPQLYFVFVFCSCPMYHVSSGVFQPMSVFTPRVAYRTTPSKDDVDDYDWEEESDDEFMGSDD
jgi:hypothetical protein